MLLLNGLKRDAQCTGQTFNRLSFEEVEKVFQYKIERLQPDTIDLDYLDEKLRENTGFLKENEITIIFD